MKAPLRRGGGVCAGRRGCDGGQRRWSGSPDEPRRRARRGGGGGRRRGTDLLGDGGLEAVAVGPTHEGLQVRVAGVEWGGSRGRCSASGGEVGGRAARCRAARWGARTWAATTRSWVTGPGGTWENGTKEREGAPARIRTARTSGRSRQRRARSRARAGLASTRTEACCSDSDDAVHPMLRPCPKACFMFFQRNMERRRL